MDSSERKRLLGAAIRRERERQGLSQRKLALMAGQIKRTYGTSKTVP